MSSSFPSPPKCSVCDGFSVFPCPHCLRRWYCCENHLESDLKRHRRDCSSFTRSRVEDFTKISSVANNPTLLSIALSRNLDQVLPQYRAILSKATSLLRSNQISDAYIALKQVHLLAENLFGPLSTQVALIDIRMASCLFFQGSPDHCILRLRRAMKIIQKSRGKDDVRKPIVDILMLLANSRVLMGEYEAAQKAFEKSENLLRHIYVRSNNPGYASAYINAGVMHLRCEKYDNAISLFTKANQLTETIFGLNPSLFACISYNLGVVNECQKNYTQAITFYQKALRYWKAARIGTDMLKGIKVTIYATSGMLGHWKDVIDKLNKIEPSLQGILKIVANYWLGRGYQRHRIDHSALASFEKCLTGMNEITEPEPEPRGRRFAAFAVGLLEGDINLVPLGRESPMQYDLKEMKADILQRVGKIRQVVEEKRSVAEMLQFQRTMPLSNSLRTPYRASSPGETFVQPLSNVTVRTPSRPPTTPFIPKYKEDSLTNEQFLLSMALSPRMTRNKVINSPFSSPSLDKLLNPLKSNTVHAFSDTIRSDKRTEVFSSTIDSPVYAKTTLPNLSSYSPASFRKSAMRSTRSVSSENN